MNHNTHTYTHTERERERGRKTSNIERIYFKHTYMTARIVTTENTIREIYRVERRSKEHHEIGQKEATRRDGKESRARGDKRENKRNKRGTRGRNK